MNNQKLTTTFLVILLLGFTLFVDAQTAYNVDKITAFSPSYVSDSEENPYQLQAIKYNKLWFFILNSQNDLEVLTIEGDSLSKTAEFFQTGVFKIIERYGMSCINQTKLINDLTLTPYYTFEGKAEKDFERILFLEYGYSKKSFFRKTINVLIYPFTFFIKKKSPYDKQLNQMNKLNGDIEKKQKAYIELSSPVL
ncbi:hypothetical protein [Flammeovirga kamogawensis]|uniref:Uncharacterized protein n=1 Tax=Flammeovirga kamogawensis TaxID=373891 RepID=A0ABX8GXV3_9BACT|nr:hypothetical protein [Flammeovirga kamogawensis]MBB6458858.1 hypothetical protein [Flammeovirga kamogawensis]QWG08439.1 hypothetical protein KM029_05750 [Flammeovirga kamogawensis]TRX66736.1 hypothetical protein EO216_00810 [Flammeovirga kamogawensis]